MCMPMRERARFRTCACACACEHTRVRPCACACEHARVRPCACGCEHARVRLCACAHGKACMGMQLAGWVSRMVRVGGSSYTLIVQYIVWKYFVICFHRVTTAW